MGEGTRTEKLLKYEVYKKMLNGKSTEDFEAAVKTKFIKEPARMKLLIVVDKLLTGFDAPSATYLYIDKSMQDHGLFQAICRVNRVHTADKDYGYIIDYKDLFKSLSKSIKDYTSEAFDDFDIDDVKGLLKDRLAEAQERLDTALEAVRAMCEPVHPKIEPAFIQYFCGNTELPQDIEDTADQRLALYKAVATLVRAYANIANDLHKVGYRAEQAAALKKEVQYYADLRDTIKKASRDYLDMKSFEPGMRQLMDMYLYANSSKKISNFENKTLVELIVQLSEPTEEYQTKTKQTAVAETIENNVRKVIIEESKTNPKYFEKMSALLKELIQQRKEQRLAYRSYLEKIKALAEQVTNPSKSKAYPTTINSKAKQALYDNLGSDEQLALAVHQAILVKKKDGWRGNKMKEKQIKIAVQGLLEDVEQVNELMDIIKNQSEY